MRTKVESLFADDRESYIEFCFMFSDLPGRGEINPIDIARDSENGKSAVVQQGSL